MHGVWANAKRSAAAFGALVVALGASVGLGSVAAAAPPALRVDQNTRLGNDAHPVRAKDRPGFAVDPADANHVVEVDEDFVEGTCDYKVTFDGGRSWTGGQLRAPSDFPSPPCPVFDTGGWSHTNASVVFGTGQNVYTTFSAFKTGDGDSLLVARSTDGGRNFAPAAVAVAGLPGGRSINIRPKVTAVARPAGDELLLVYWGCETPGACSLTHRAMSVASQDGGATWALPVVLQLPTDGPSTYPSQAAAGPDGTLYVAYRRVVEGQAGALPRSSLVLATSKDNGASWSYSDIATDAGPVEQDGSEPKLAIEPRDGTLYLAYQARLFDSGDGDIAFQRRDRGASTWSAPVRVNDDPRATKVNQRFPWMAVAPDGRIDIAWHDQRNAYPGNRLDDFYYASSNDRGRTFSTNRRLTDRTENLDVGLDVREGTFSFYWPAVAAVADGAVLAAWPDSREGNADTDSQDIYIARVAPGVGATPRRDLRAANGVAMSAALSRLAYPGGAEQVNGEKATRVVIVNEADAPGAEAGAVLARAVLGPVLLSTATGLTTEVTAEVRRLRPAGAVVIGDEGRVPAGVVDQLVAAGVPKDAVTRIADADAPTMAQRVAEAIPDRRSDTAAPRYPEVVIANAQSAEAGGATNLAAALRLPILFVGRDSIPAPTSAALKSFATANTFVIGGPAVISDAVQAQLPKPVRLGGATPASVTAATTSESLRRRLPANVVYLADAQYPVQAAVLGAAVARLGGLMLENPGADADAARLVLTSAGLNTVADRIVVLRSGGPSASRPSVPAQTLAASGGGLSPLPLLALITAALWLLRVTRSARHERGATNRS